ncbi:11746_t:CDS:1 [Funneliformis geosporum]|uniref:protein-tyrosine-phosphatase n=1 Tax=Funneliformis geosporum TaxID=1117311 RepID=A0A9W4X5V3_9GLOM|nr:11746_t:CDS:1 [Funneliformis geosporum]CAI2188742.1 10781_t:CDS:1 [Funneliformis geosporum]
METHLSKSQNVRTSLLDLVTLAGAENSKKPTIIIPEFLYLGDAKTACWFPHFVSNNITHVINLSGCSNFWETKENIYKNLSKSHNQHSSDQSEELKFINKVKQVLFPEKDNVLSNGNGEIIDNMKYIDNNDFIPPKYLKIDIADDPSSDIYKHFCECIGFIENAKSTNGHVYIHCQAGISRSVTIVIAYLMSSQKISYKQAFDLIKEKRPIAKPNHGFIKQLREFEKEVIDKEHRHLF